MDSRITELAHGLIHYSTRLQKGERVLIDIGGQDAYPLAEALIEEAYAIGAYPYLHLSDAKLSRALLMGNSEEQLNFNAELLLQQMKGMHAYIAVRAVHGCLAPLNNLGCHMLVKRLAVDQTILELSAGRI